MTVYVGSRVMARPCYMPGDKAGKTPPQPGTVTYIHPERRYALVAFDAGPRECFSMMDLEGHV